MARAKKKATRKTAKRGTRSMGGSRRGGAGQDAISLLKSDHRQVETWFDQFESSRSDERKKTLATQICQALKVHTQIEAEIFYPAFLQATGDQDIHHEAEVEHDGAKKLIGEIEGSGPDDDYFDARVTVLSEMIKHHVNEEEKRDGMFAKAKQAKMDLAGLGERLAARKAELMGSEGQASRSQARRSRDAGVFARLATRIRRA